MRWSHPEGTQSCNLFVILHTAIRTVIQAFSSAKEPILHIVLPGQRGTLEKHSPLYYQISGLCISWV